MVGDEAAPGCLGAANLQFPLGRAAAGWAPGRSWWCIGAALSVVKL